MKTILSAAGRAALRDGLIAFLALASGIWVAPNLDQQKALATAAVIAGLIAAVRAVRAFAPGLATALARMLNVPESYAETVITGLTTLIVAFIVLVEGVLSAPDLATGKSVWVAGLLALGTTATRLLQALFTPGESPAPTRGLAAPGGS